MKRSFGSNCLTALGCALITLITSSNLLAQENEAKRSQPSPPAQTSRLAGQFGDLQEGDQLTFAKGTRFDFTNGGFGPSIDGCSSKATKLTRDALPLVLSKQLTWTVSDRKSGGGGTDILILTNRKAPGKTIFIRCDKDKTLDTLKPLITNLKLKSEGPLLEASPAGETHKGQPQGPGAR